MGTRKALTAAARLGTAGVAGLLAIGSTAAPAEGLRHTGRPVADSNPAYSVPAAKARLAIRTRRAGTPARSAGAGFDPMWLYAYVERLVGAKADMPRRVAGRHPGLPRPQAVALRPASPEPVPAPPVGEPNRPITVDAEKAGRVARTPAAAAPATTPVPATPAAASPVVTGALSAPSPRPAADAAAGASVRPLDPVQAATDIVRLELASRVYRETKLAGERVFQLSRDWLVLERARDSLTDADQSAAEASGFDAVAYVNDKDRIVVVAIAGTQDVRRDFFANDVWQALIRAQAPQQFYLATQYIRSVKRRYVGAGYTIECVGHSLGGGACAYAAAEIGIDGRVINPISAGRLDARADRPITNYVVDGEIASLVYGARGNGLSGNVQVVDDGHAPGPTRARAQERLGALAGIAFVVDEIREAIVDHRVDTALDRIARQAGLTRMH